MVRISNLGDNTDLGFLYTLYEMIAIFPFKSVENSVYHRYFNKKILSIKNLKFLLNITSHYQVSREFRSIFVKKKTNYSKLLVFIIFYL